MNLYRLTVITLRLWGVDLIINAPLRFLYLPGWLYGLFSHQLHEFAQTRDGISTGMLLVRVVLDLALGIYLIDASPSIARWLMGSLNSYSAVLKHGNDVWPPAPIQSPLKSPKPVPPSYDPASAIRNTAILLLRVNGLGRLIGLLYDFTDLPKDIFALIHYHSGYYGVQYLLSILATIADGFAALAIGLFFLTRPQRLVNWMTSDLVQDAETEDRNAASVILS